MTQLSEPMQPPASSRKALNVLWVLAILVVFAVGLAIRLYDLTDLPLDFNPTRQLHSMLIARGIYYQNLTSAPAWQRDLAVQQWKAEGLIEPQIMEHLAAYTYDLLGEHLWIPRLYAIFFWVLGGLALYWLARDMTSRAGGLVALVFYLIVPFGAIASRAFQPDPLMVCTLIFALWAVYHWVRTPNWKWTIIAGLLAGLTIYVKSTAVFFIGGALIGLMLGGVGLKKALLNPKVWALGVLAVVPYGIYHVYGVYVIKLLQSQFSLRFFPQMWTDLIFYLRWNGEIRGAVGTEMFLAALVGTFLFSTRAKRSIMLGLWGGYFVYGVLFSYYTGSHDYYQEPLIPIVALGLAAVTDVVFQRISELKPGAWAYVAITDVILFGVTITGWDVRNTLKRNVYTQEAPYWAALGEKLRGDSIVALSQDYGYRLEYWGWLTPDNWPVTGDFNLRELAGYTIDPLQWFQEQVQGKQYFLVTMLAELDNQPEIKKVLYDNYPIYDKGDGYVIFDLQHPLSQPATTTSSTTP